MMDCTKLSYSKTNNLPCILQTQMEDLRQKMGSTLSERYTSQQKGTAKMMNDYEKMRKDLMKVCLIHQKS